MTLSQIFKAAHKLAKELNKSICNYKIALSKALKAIHSQRDFYKKMSHRIKPVGLQIGASSSANGHNYFCNAIQYAIVFESISKIQYDGFWLSDIETL